MGARNIDKGQIKNIYAIAAKLGMLDRSSHEDALHELVQGLTGKESIKELTPSEGLAVLTELRRRGAPAASAPRKKQPRKYEELPGGVTEGQQKKIWYFMFQLEKFDPAPEGVQLRDRLCGLISKQFKLTSFPSQPFRFLTYQQGSVLIEGLKSQVQRKELEYLHSDRYRKEQEAAGK